MTARTPEPPQAVAEAPAEPAAGASWRAPESVEDPVEDRAAKPAPTLPPDIVPEQPQQPKKGWWRKALGQ